MTDSTPLISPATPLLFMHVPKSGGMSLFTAFTALWGENIADLYDLSLMREGEAFSALADQSKALYCGHYAFGLHEWLARPSYYTAVVREPVARMISLHNYCQPMLKVYKKRYQEAGGDLAAMAKLPRTSDFYLDFEPWFQGEGTPQEFFSSPCAELDNGMVRRFSGYGLGPAPCPDGALAKAKENIENRFSVVGILERYPETLELMAKTFGLPSLKENHVNRNSVKTEEAALPEDIVATIREMNRLDSALYAWICERFDHVLVEGRQPVRLPGGGRTDSPISSLWRAVGQSPVREAAMKARGLPPPLKKGARPVPAKTLCNGVDAVLMNANAIMADMQFQSFKGERPGDKKATSRLVIPPKLAKEFAKNLILAVEKYEEKFGPIE